MNGKSLKKHLVIKEMFLAATLVGWTERPVNVLNSARFLLKGFLSNGGLTSGGAIAPKFSLPSTRNYTVSPKNDTPLACYNFNNLWQITVAKYTQIRLLMPIQCYFLYLLPGYCNGNYVF